MLRGLDFRTTNGRIGALFMVGSALFALPSIPAVSSLLGAAPSSLTYFVGSIFFTAAATLQLRSSTRRSDRLAAGVQFVGTLCFNVSTFLAVADSFRSIDHPVLTWTPDAYGSTAFLISSAIAMVIAKRDVSAGTGAAARHRASGTWPRLRDRVASALRRDWHAAGRDLHSDEIWIAVLNLLGSIAFGLSAIAAFFIPHDDSVLNAAAVSTWTLVGAIGFFVAAFLLVEEKDLP